MKPLTKLQKEEILHHITMRAETVEADPDSGDEFENTDGALERLRMKINEDRADFEADEVTWMVRELENCEDIAWSNFRSEGPKVLGYTNSMQNAVNKLKHNPTP